MDQIALIIYDNVSKQTTQTLHYSVIQTTPQILIETMCDELFWTMDMSKVSELVINVSDLGIPNATLISFRYDGRICEVGEKNDAVRDYFWVKMLPV
jgi:hypothetical protein